MRTHSPIWMRRAALVAVVVLAASCVAASMASARMASATVRADALRQAHRSWDSRPFVRYRMVLQAPSWCRMDMEISNEQIAKVYENSCPGAPKTVSDLFDFVRQLDSHPDTVYCAADGCECVEQRFVLAEYDAQFGFPRVIRARRQRTANLDGLWAYMLARGLPNCLTPRDTEVVRVLSFQPLS